MVVYIIFRYEGQFGEYIKNKGYFQRCIYMPWNNY
jgi:hypothetical protein